MMAVIGCGNPARSDDGAGCWVLAQLAARGWTSVSPALRLFDAATDGMAVMFQARGCDQLIIVDACSGGEAGAVYRLCGEELATLPEAGMNLHAFRWDHALYAGRRIFGDGFPQRVTVYLVGTQSLAPGLELSDAASTAAQQVLAEVEQQLSDYLQPDYLQPRTSDAIRR